MARNVLIFMVPLASFLVAPFGCAPADTLPVPRSETNINCVRIDGSPFDETTVENSEAVVYVFVAVQCPISNRYAPEVNRIRKMCLENRQQLFVVYPDREAQFEVLRQHAVDYGFFEFALWDKDHDLTDRCGANYTPEAVVILGSDEQSNGEIVYRGRIDNWYVGFGKAKAAAEVHDLRDVLAAVSAKVKLEFRETKVIGCPIPRFDLESP